MNSRKAIFVMLAVMVAAGVQAQKMTTPKNADPNDRSHRNVYNLDASALNMNALLPSPSAVGSPANNAALVVVHRIEQTRTPQQVAEAKASYKLEDIFIYQNVFGPGFNPKSLPRTAALGEHVKDSQDVFTKGLRHQFRKPRPYQTDATLHPVCGVDQDPDSYPAGHAFTGYLKALTLTQLAPEKRDQILARADQYAYDGAVCGEHYPADSEASRRVAYAVFGYMMSSPKFQQDLAAAREEMRTKLGAAEN